ncbi:uncharacterized protein [Watersipora subatra]|uniref:uncharacterized protein n=1 Tax=Watersipora subatra TaxID=2589382 RepID=UPI00355C34F2
MRIMRFNRQIINEFCLIMTCIAVVGFFLVVAIIRASIAGILSQCDTDLFVNNFCEAVRSGKVEGGACDWLCSDKEGEQHWRTLSLCDRHVTHQMSNSKFISSSTGVVFAVEKDYLEKISKPYVLHATVQPEGDTFTKASSRAKAMFRKVLDQYLNAGSHDALLNSVRAPSKEPIPDSYVQSVMEILSNRRFVLSLLFYGSGDRSMEVHGTATESIPAVSLDYTCAGVYQTYNLGNNTTPMTDMIGGKSSWSLGASITRFRLYEVVLSLLDIEETTSEHAYEGVFYFCNLNTSQLLLHNDCVKYSQSESYMLSHPCTLKTLDISTMIFSRDQVQRQLEAKTCHTNKDCLFYSCRGICSNGHCQLSTLTSMAGILQICQLLRRMEDQILEGSSGQFYSIIDRCLDLPYYPESAANSGHHYIIYNSIFQELKDFFLDLFIAQETKMKRHVEHIAAEKEARKRSQGHHK